MTAWFVFRDIPDHPHVGRIHACFEKPSACVVSRFIDGPSLITYLQDNGPPSVSEARRIALEMALGLQHLHKHGVAHLNLSSWNVLVRMLWTPLCGIPHTLIDVACVIAGGEREEGGAGGLWMDQALAPAAELGQEEEEERMELAGSGDDDGRSVEE